MLKSARGLTLHYEAVHVVPRDLRFRSPPAPAVQDTGAPSFEPDPVSQPLPSPTSSSQCSPRRTHSGSPLQTSQGQQPRVTINVNHEDIEIHPLLDATPCDADGFDLENHTPPPPAGPHDPTDYSPFADCATFKLAEFLFAEDEMSANNVDRLINIISTLYPDKPPPFISHTHMYSLIDSIKQGDVAWQSFSITYQGAIPESGPVPTWMREKFEVWFRDPLEVMEDQIGNPDFKHGIDYAPKRIFKNGKRRFRDLMTGNWAWDQADKIAVDPSTHGAMFAPIVLGSDKTTVSVATGHNEYYPLYGSLGSVHNSLRRAHRNAVALIGFLAIPKTSREHKDSADFRKFRRQLFHASLEHILSSLRPHMTTPRITKCADGHYRRVIYGLGPYIADYPEQALLACIVQNWCAICTGRPENLDGDAMYRSHHHTSKLLETFTLKDLWDHYGIVGDLIPFTDYFPRADIHELIAPDLLHQIIKGTFKDHLVDWIEAYIKLVHQDTPGRAAGILADIDRRIAAAPPFPGLRRFPQGRGFKQWTGNDSKGLMKVYLAAIHGHVPAWMTRAVAALIDLCYLVRRSTIDEDTVTEIEAALARFHHYREVFRNTGVRADGFSLPRQHSLSHYPSLIKQFGAPNGLCSSITESKHIKAVKRPYRRSNKNKPLGQMLVTNQRLDKLAAARTFFKAKHMLDGPEAPVIAALRQLNGTQPLSPATLQPAQVPRENQEEGALDGPRSMSEISLAKTHVRNLPSNIHLLAGHLERHDLPELTARFLYNQLHPDAATPGSDVPRDELPMISGTVKVFNSARAVFYAPSDLSGDGGMRHERIRSMRSWYGGSPRYDCVFIGKSDDPGFKGLHVARVFLFFSFSHQGTTYPCALVNWFSPLDELPCPDTGMWMVEPDVRLVRGRTRRVLEVVHLDSIMRGAHLLGIAGRHLLPLYGLNHTNALDQFHSFYVNKFADHHAHEVAF
ncbi:hypothetical protein D9615_006850 [Tricholomella constricta]|uniref:Uncharacterized protein n=1 Tax=Tricholomella constricta TaxID=117010 RepID=A0A8H5H8Z0_9AGAR|nr:hypothetical protein D9615_006850 [Tricholomella constricta]